MKKLNEIKSKLERKVKIVKDPLCNMEVDENKAAKTDYKGKIYYFCSQTCQWAFEKYPNKFAK